MKPKRKASTVDKQYRDLQMQLLALASKLEAAQDLAVDDRNSDDPMARFIALSQGPIRVDMTIGQAHNVARLLRDLANGKSLAQSSGLPARPRGRPVAQSMLFYFVGWLRLRATPLTKQRAHAELIRNHAGAKVPSIGRLDRWWSDQSQDQRRAIMHIAEKRSYVWDEKKSQRYMERHGPDVSAVIDEMNRGAHRGRG